MADHPFRPSLWRASFAARSGNSTVLRARRKRITSSVPAQPISKMLQLAAIVRSPDRRSVLMAVLVCVLVCTVQGRAGMPGIRLGGVFMPQLSAGQPETARNSVQPVLQLLQGPGTA